jgi:hypothetical protein
MEEAADSLERKGLVEKSGISGPHATENFNPYGD